MKKVLSIILSFCLLLSTFTCLAGVVASAENEWLFNGAAADIPDEVPFSIGGTAVGTKIEIDNGFRNILYEKDYELRCHHEDGSKCSSIWFDKKYGLANSYLENVDINPSSRATYPEVDVIFDLSAAVTPEYFAFINRPETHLQTAEFEVYVADTYEEAISNPAFLINYTRPEDDTINHHVNVYKFPENPDTFNYLIVRLKKDNNNGYDGYRLNDIMLFGQDPSVNAGEWVYTGPAKNTPAEDFPLVQGNALSVGSNLPMKEGYTNLLPGKEYEIYCHHADNSADCSNIYKSQVDKMSSGVITNVDINPISTATVKNREVDILFDLKKETIPEFFLFINRNNVQRQIVEFDLLGANTYDEAKTSPTLIANYNRGADTTSDHHVLAYKFPENTPSYRYIIVRLKKDTFGDAAGYRLTQIALTGEVVQGGWIHDGAVADMDETIPVHISGSASGSTISFDEGYANHLIGKNMDVVCYKGENKTTISGSNTWSKTANGLMDNVDYLPSNMATYNEVDLIFDLKGTVVPEYFVFVNRATTNQQTNKYEIYGANSYEEARLNPTLIATYERNPKDNTTNKQVNIFEFTEGGAGYKYFVVRLLDDNYEGPNPGYRLMELMLLGDYTADPTGVEISHFEDNLGSVLDSAKALTAEKITYLQNEETCTLQASNEKNLQDGNLNNEAYFTYKFAEYDKTTDTAIWYTDGTRTMEIVYDLGGKYNLSNVHITHHKGIQWRASEYEIYASKEREDLFSDESLVTKVYNPVPAQNQVITPNFDKRIRYVALKYINPVSTTNIDRVKEGNIYPRIYEFRVYGTKADCNNNHNIVKVDRAEPDIFTDGMEAHYGCTECDLIFSDAEGNNVVDPADYVIPATGYPYHESYEEGQNFKLQKLLEYTGAQGAAVWGNTLFSLNQFGRCSVFDITTSEHLGSFNLASYNAGYDSEGNADPRYMNHSNTANFSTVFFHEDDQFPLLYVTTGTSNDRDTDNSLITKVSVERITCSQSGVWKAECVQTIQYDDFDYLLDEGEENPRKDGDPNRDYYLKNNWNGESFKYVSGEGYDASKGYETGLLRWFNTHIDINPNSTTAGKMYVTWDRFDQNPSYLAKYKANYEGFESYEKNDAVIITEFDIPALPTSESDPAYGATVTITPADITDQSVYSHSDGVLQSGVIHNGILYFVRGCASQTYPYYMDSMQAYDLTTKERVGNYKLYESEAWKLEPEGLCIWNGELFMSMAHTGFVFDYVALDREGEEHICSLCGKNMGKHTVNFYDKMGNLIHSAEVSDSETLSADALKNAIDSIPNIFGYNKGVNGNYWNADTSVPITEDTSFTAVYTRAEIAATLTVEDGGNIETYNYSFDEKVTITAKNEADFLGWKDSTTGAVVSKSPTYSFYMYGNVFFTAVYKTEEITSLEKDISILNVPTHYDLGETHFDVTLTASSFVPAGATVTDKGIILTNKTGYAECGGEVTLDIKTKQIAKSKRIADGNYMITVTGIKNGQTRYARAYVTYILDGETYTAYSRNTEKISNE